MTIFGQGLEKSAWNQTPNPFTQMATQNAAPNAAPNAASNLFSNSTNAKTSYNPFQSSGPKPNPFSMASQGNNSFLKSGTGFSNFTNNTNPSTQLTTTSTNQTKSVPAQNNNIFIQTQQQLTSSNAQPKYKVIQPPPDAFFASDPNIEQLKSLPKTQNSSFINPAPMTNIFSQTGPQQTGTAKTETSKTETPKTETTKAETPNTETSKTETPKTEAPKTEALKTEAPKTEAPKTEAPKTEAPKTEAPKTEAPKTEAPKTEAPKTETPKTETQKAGELQAGPPQGNVFIQKEVLSNKENKENDIDKKNSNSDLSKISSTSFSVPASSNLPSDQPFSKGNDQNSSLWTNSTGPKKSSDASSTTTAYNKEIHKMRVNTYNLPKDFVIKFYEMMYRIKPDIKQTEIDKELKELASTIS